MHQIYIFHLKVTIVNILVNENVQGNRSLGHHKTSQSKNSIFYDISTTNIAPPGGEIIFFIEASLRVLLYHMQTQFFGYLYPSGESQKLCDNLKQRP